jgi:flavin-dependent dehydrogenase
MNAYEYVILGGGIAGLCAAKRFLELGIEPLIIEASGYPTHKVCGEFLSPSSMPILKKWDIHPVAIHQMSWHTPSSHLKMGFPMPAGTLSHLTLDTQLADQVTREGATLLTHMKVLDLLPPSYNGETHTLVLSNGEKVFAKHLVIATGRLPHSLSRAPSFRYMGFKAHFSGLNLDSTLFMFSFKGAYLGLAPVENGRANLACLAKIENVRQAPSSQSFIQNLLHSHPLLHQLLAPGQNLFEKWMETPVPEFGIRSTPHWPQTYFIGDAAITIPPACGNGLSLAIASGYLAAEYAKREDPSGFKQAWRKRCFLQMMFGKRLHSLFLNPALGSVAIFFSNWFPSLARGSFNVTRDPGL